MARGILPGHDCCAGRRTHALRIEGAKARALGSQARHVRRAIPLIERMDYWLSGIIREKRHRRIHQPHVIDQKDDDIRFTCRPYAASSKERKEPELEDARHAI